MHNALLLLVLGNLPLQVDTRTPLGRFDQQASRSPQARGSTSPRSARLADRVADGVYRSGQPSRADFMALQRDYGLRSVLKLNHGADDVPPGVKVHAHPLNGLVEPSQKTVEEILDEIDHAEKPILIHCSHGEDRTGLIVALYRIRHGEPSGSAYADMLAHGFHPWPGLWRYWLKAVGWAKN